MGYRYLKVMHGIINIYSTELAKVLVSFLVFLGAKELELGSRRVIIVFVPVPLLQTVQKIQVSTFD